MARHTLRTTTISLDTCSIIRKLYPTTSDFYHEHFQDTDVTIQRFYDALRSEPTTPEIERLVEAGVTWKLRQLGWDRDTLDTVTPMSTLLTDLVDYLKKQTPTETQSQLLFQLQYQMHVGALKQDLS